MSRKGWIGSSFLIIAIVIVGSVLATWKYSSIQGSIAASTNQPEPIESITAATAKERSYRPSTTSIGTVTALRSVTLQNEIAGTVHRVSLNPGQIVEKGTVLVQLDVSVEEAELKEQQARAALAESMLKRMESVGQTRAVSQTEVDRARAEQEVALAQVQRTRAVIARKTIRAPFRAVVGISDVHTGQYLTEGTQLTTLQGVGEAVHVDFAVPQQVAAGLKNGDSVDVFTTNDTVPVAAKVVAVDARVDRATRNAMVRARIEHAANNPAPGASVRVQIPVGQTVKAVAIPVSSLRKGPQGDHVFVIEPDKSGKTRVHTRVVQAGTMLGDEVLVVSGLKPGEEVAASGSFKLREDALVVVSALPLK